MFSASWWRRKRSSRRPLIVESKGIKLIKPELKSVKPVVLIHSNSKFKIQLSKPNVDPKTVSKAVVDEVMKNAPRDKSEGAGINFQEVSNRGSGALCAGPLLTLVTFEGEKQKGPLGDFKLIKMRDCQNSKNVLFLNGPKARLSIPKFSIVKIEDVKNTKSKKEGFELFAMATTSRTKITVVEGFKAQFSGVCRGEFLLSGVVVGTGDIHSYK